MRSHKSTERVKTIAAERSVLQPSATGENSRSTSGAPRNKKWSRLTNHARWIIAATKSRLGEFCLSLVRSRQARNVKCDFGAERNRRACSGPKDLVTTCVGSSIFFAKETEENVDINLSATCTAMMTRKVCTAALLLTFWLKRWASFDLSSSKMA